MKEGLDISFHIYNDLWREKLKPYQKTIRNILETAFLETHFGSYHGKIEMAVVLADDGFVRNLNYRYRGKDKPTNILSFPDEDFAISHNLGDLVLAFKTIEKEAKEQEKAFRDHVTHLLIHGFLHLIGYDHIKEKQAADMEKKEIKILKKLGINNPYL